MGYKLKTHSGAKKRFKLSGKGKLIHRKAGQRHLLIGMSSSRGRKLRRNSTLNTKDGKNIRTLLPYAG